MRKALTQPPKAGTVSIDRGRFQPQKGSLFGPSTYEEDGTYLRTHQAENLRMSDAMGNETPEYGTRHAPTLFKWTKFYEALAGKLRAYAEDRNTLIQWINEVAAEERLSYLEEVFPDGSRGPMEDICPFTAMGLFNRQMTAENRTRIARKIGKLLGVVEPAPESFEAIPTQNNRQSWFYGYARDRGSNDLNILWNVFMSASKFVHSHEHSDRQAFAKAYDTALGIKGVAWNLSTGLFRAYPWNFLTLDEKSRTYITDDLSISIQGKGQRGPIDAESYLNLIDTLRKKFEEDGCPVHSFPELSYAADDGNVPVDPARIPAPRRSSYSVEDIRKDGCFLRKSEIALLLERLRMKKNLVLQGPPGTGKTWLAKRLAFALMGQRNSENLSAVQFHESYAYEDFVGGFRPSVRKGQLVFEAKDGAFLRLCEEAKANPETDIPYVMLIDEINRGNLSRVFGELLMLIEPDKRDSAHAIELQHRRHMEGKGSNLGDESFYVPPNIYIVGTMNLADRSLTGMNIAMRRRFAFFDLRPRFDSKRFREWLNDRKMPIDLRNRICEKMESLNKVIQNDPSLGENYAIGHSFFCPDGDGEIDDWKKWHQSVVDQEIRPLLKEYWFDDPEKADDQADKLLAGE